MCVKYVCVFVFFAASYIYTNTARVVIPLDLGGPHIESGKEAVSTEGFSDFIYSL